MKKLLIFFLIMISAVGLMSCGKNSIKFNRINSPKELQCVNNIVFWDKVSKADYYILSINDIEYKIEEQNQYFLDSSLYAGETLEIKILAGNKSKDIADSKYSNSIIVDFPGGMEDNEIRSELSSYYSSDVVDNIMTVAKANGISNKNIIPLIEIFHMFINGEAEKVSFTDVTSSGTQVMGFLIDYLDQIYTSGELNIFFKNNRDKMIKVLSLLFAFDKFKETSEYEEIVSAINDFPKAQVSSKIVRGIRNDILSMVERFMLDEVDVLVYIDAYSKFLVDYGYKFNVNSDDALVKSKVVEYSLYAHNYLLWKYDIFCSKLTDKKIKNFCESELSVPILKFYSDVVASIQYKDLDDKICKLEYDHLEYITDDSAGLSSQINDIISQSGKIKIDLSSFMLEFKNDVSLKEYKQINTLRYKYYESSYKSKTVRNNPRLIIKTKGGFKIGGTPSRFDYVDKETVEYYQLAYQARSEIYPKIARSDLKIYFNYISAVYKALSKNLINAGANYDDFAQLKDGLYYVGNRLEEYMDETIDFCYKAFNVFGKISDDLNDYEDFKNSGKTKISDVLINIIAEYGYNGIDGGMVNQFIRKFNAYSGNEDFIEDQAQLSFHILFYV